MNNIEELEGKEFIVEYGKYNPIDGCVEIANRKPLVRCKDCVHFRRFAEKEFEYATDGYCCYNDSPMYYEDYCSDGEGKTE